MARDGAVYACQSCGAVATKWSGQCQSCSAWNSLVEEVASRAEPLGGQRDDLAPRRAGRVKRVHERRVVGGHSGAQAAQRQAGPLVGGELDQPRQLGLAPQGVAELPAPVAPLGVGDARESCPTVHREGGPVARVSARRRRGIGWAFPDGPRARKVATGPVRVKRPARAAEAWDPGRGRVIRRGGC